MFEAGFTYIFSKSLMNTRTKIEKLLSVTSLFFLFFVVNQIIIYRRVEVTYSLATSSEGGITIATQSQNYEFRITHYELTPP